MGNRLGHRLKIRTESLMPGDWHIELDGVDISHGLTGVTLNLGAHEPTKAKLELHVDHLDVDAKTLSVLQAHVESSQAAA